jgi:hypothetical protein
MPKNNTQQPYSQAESVWATTITNNYIEDFGRTNTQAPSQKDPNNTAGAVAGSFFGIGCNVNGGAR